MPDTTEVRTTPIPRRKKKVAGNDKGKGLRIDIYNRNAPELEALGIMIQSLNKIDKKSGNLSGKIVIGGKKKA